MPVFFTIVTKSHLAYARVLGRQLAKFHPNCKFIVVLVDRPDGYFNPENENFQIIALSEILDAEWWPKAIGYYTAYELCNAAKPFVHDYLISKKCVSHSIYIDSDVYLMGSLNCVLEDLGERSILVTPHLLKPDLTFSQEILEQTLIWSGIFNGGFMVVRGCDESRTFLDWWKKRLVWNCTQHSGPIEVDQSWLNFAPALFTGFTVARRTGLNVAHWNLHEREISLSNKMVVVGDSEQLLFFHFSGWDFNRPEIVTRHLSFSHDLGYSESAAWAYLWKEYLTLLQEEGIRACSHYPYSFGIAKDGSILTSQMRKKYLTSLKMPDKSAPTAPSIFQAPETYSASDSRPPVMGLRHALYDLKIAFVEFCRRMMRSTV